MGLCTVLPPRTQGRPSARASTMLSADAPRAQQTGGAGERRTPKTIKLQVGCIIYRR